MEKRFAYRIHKATDMHSEHVMPHAFARQQKLLESASPLLVYVCCLSCCVINTTGWGLSA